MIRDKSFGTGTYAIEYLLSLLVVESSPEGNQGQRSSVPSALSIGCLGVGRVKVGSYFALQNLHPTLDTRLMCGKYRLCKRAGFEQGKAEDNGIGCKGKNRAVQIVRYYHVIHQDGVNADAYHNEEALKAEGD